MRHASQGKGKETDSGKAEGDNRIMQPEEE
jgi:hypothetical protein